MQFVYKAQNKLGEIFDGVIDAPDKFTAAKEIRERGEMPVYVGEPRSKIRKDFVEDLFGTVKLHEKIIFTRNLSGMLSAGLSLSRALSILEKQTLNKKLKGVLIEIMKGIDRGGTLSDGMQKFPKVFSTLFVSMVRAGEESGGLSKSLDEIGSHLEKSYALNKKIKGAMMYPAIIVSAIVIIGVLMFIYVVPTLTGTFKELGADLPASTRFIIFISDALKNNLLMLVFIVALFIGAVIYLSKRPNTKRFFDYITLRLPAIGVIVKEVNSARTARTLSSLLNSGVDMSKAISITKEVLQNSYYKEVMDLSVISVQKGVPLSAEFKKRTDLYPLMVGEMIEVGEETGQLSDMLKDIAKFYEEEVDTKTKDLSTIIEPVLMVLIGGGVGFFAISMISPMYSLMNNIK